jgi:hypothetical protein
MEFGMTQLSGSRPRLARGLVVATALTTAFAWSTTGAQATPGQTDTGSTVVTVGVGSAITLTGLTPAFSLDGTPGQTITKATAVTMTVTTNNAQGYSVTVQSAAATLTPTVTTTTDTIPIDDLQVRETGTTPFTPLSATAPVQVHTQDGPSAEAGDTINNDYQITIPFVAPDTYTATLNYVATTL